MRRRRLLRGVAVGAGTGTLTTTQEVEAQADSRPGTEQWRFDTEDFVVSSPTVADGTVYVGSRDSNLYAVDATSGNEQWRFETGDEIESSPTVADGTVYVGSRDSNLYAVDATSGNEQWRFETGDAVFSSPTVADGTVYVGGGDTNLYAVNKTDGTEQWRFDTGDDLGYSSPTLADATIYIGSDDSNLYAVDAVSGDEQWRFETGDGVGSSPTVADGTIYVGSSDNNLYAVDATSGNEQWRFETGDSVGSVPTVADGSVYVGSRDSNLYAVDATSGNEQWRFETEDWVDSAPTVADATIYIGSDDSNLYAVDSTSGNEQWRFETGGDVWSSPTVADGTIYVGSTDSNLYAVNVANSNASSEGSRVLLGTLGHTDRFNFDAPAANTKFTSTPTPTPTPTTENSDNGNLMWILLGLLGVGGGSVYYWFTSGFSRETGGSTISSADESTQPSDSALSGTNSSGNVQTQNQSQEHTSLSADELWETYHSLSERNTEYPQHDPAAVEDRLNQAQRLLPGKTDDQTHTENSEDTETNLVEARDHLSEAQRLAGPTVEYFLNQARQFVTDARASQEDGDIDAAVSLWQDAQHQYEQARERATELNDSRKSEIAETCTTVTERLAEAKRRQTESDIQQAITSAWNELITGDEYVADGSPKSGGKTAYKMATEEYHTASNHLDGSHTDIDVADADSIKTAITITQDAQADCESIDILRRTRSELTKFVDSEKSTSLPKLTAILSELNELPRKNESLYEQILTAVLCINLETVRAELQQARAHFEQNEYQEASAALDGAETHMTTAADMVQEAPTDISAEPQSAVDTMQGQLDVYRTAVTEALTDINADPTLEPVSEIILTPPSISELPSESDICQAVPARSTLWETVTPELQPEYDALQSLLATVDASAFARWVSTEYDKRMTSHQTALDNIEPITASEKLPAQREKILTDCRAIVSALTQRATTDLTALEDANLPDDFYESPEEIPQVDTESRLGADDIEEFTQEWSESVNMLTEILHSLNTAVSVIEAYDEVADIIEKKLATSRTVSSEELPINFAEQALRLYAHRRSDIDFDPDQSLIYMIS